MKKIILFVISLIISFNVISSETPPPINGPKVGNGGGGLICQSKDKINWVILLDSFELKFDPRLKMTMANFEEMPYQEILDVVLERSIKIFDFFPLSEIDLFLPNILDSIHFTRNKLVNTNDSNFTMPRQFFRHFLCLDGNGLEYIQVASYYRDTLYIDQKMFDHLPEEEKAILFFHEAIYLILRKHFQDKDSYRTRRLVSIVFSTSSVIEAKKMVKEIIYSAPHH